MIHQPPYLQYQKRKGKHQIIRGLKVKLTCCNAKLPTTRMSLLQPIKKLQYSAHQICLLSPLSICDSFKHGLYFPSPCTCASVIHTGVSFIFRKVNQVTNLVSEVKGEQKLCCCDK